MVITLYFVSMRIYEPPPTKFLPVLRYPILTPLYDMILIISGLGASFKKRILEKIKIKPTETIILDVGCGTGTLLKVLHDKLSKKTLIGIDPDPLNIKHIEQSNFAKTANLKLFIGYAEKLPVNDTSVDMCISILTFHHLTTNQKQEAFNEVMRVLKTGDRFILVDWGILRFSFLRWFLFFEKAELIKDNISGRIPEIAKQSGFELIYCERVKFSGIWLWEFKK